MSTTNPLIGQIAFDMAELPEDLPLVVEFVHYLQKRKTQSLRRALTVKEIRALARKKANALQDVPREHLVARFQTLAEEIRQQSIANNTAVEGDWRGD